LAKGQLESSAFEIINIVGKNETIIGFWTPKRGLSQELEDSTREVADSMSKDKLLKHPIWPGNTTYQPTKLRIRVPIKQGFVDFLKVEWLNPHTDKPIISGFSYDVFNAVLDALPFPLPYEFIPFMNDNRTSNGTYDELLYQIKL
jgi:ionotropic glutamate receptor